MPRFSEAYPKADGRARDTPPFSAALSAAISGASSSPRLSTGGLLYTPPARRVSHPGPYPHPAGVADNTRPSRPSILAGRNVSRRTTTDRPPAARSAGRGLSSAHSHWSAYPDWDEGNESDTLYSYASSAFSTRSHSQPRVTFSDLREEYPPTTDTDSSQLDEEESVASDVELVQQCLAQTTRELRMAAKGHLDTDKKRSPIAREYRGDFSVTGPRKPYKIHVEIPKIQRDPPLTANSITVGPIIGVTTATTTRILIEAARDHPAVTLTLREKSNAHDVEGGLSPPHILSQTVRGGRPSIFCFGGLRPFTEYEVLCNLSMPGVLYSGFRTLALDMRLRGREARMAFVGASSLEFRQPEQRQKVKFGWQRVYEAATARSVDMFVHTSGVISGSDHVFPTFDHTLDEEVDRLIATHRKPASRICELIRRHYRQALTKLPFQRHALANAPHIFCTSPRDLLLVSRDLRHKLIVTQCAFLVACEYIWQLRTDVCLEELFSLAAIESPRTATTTTTTTYHPATASSSGRPSPSPLPSSTTLPTLPDTFALSPSRKSSSKATPEVKAANPEMETTTILKEDPNGVFLPSFARLVPSFHQMYCFGDVSLLILDPILPLCFADYGTGWHALEMLDDLVHSLGGKGSLFHPTRMLCVVTPYSLYKYASPVTTYAEGFRRKLGFETLTAVRRWIAKAQDGRRNAVFVTGGEAQAKVERIDTKWLIGASVDDQPLYQITVPPVNDFAPEFDWLAKTFSRVRFRAKLSKKDLISEKIFPLRPLSFNPRSKWISDRSFIVLAISARFGGRRAEVHPLMAWVDGAPLITEFEAVVVVPDRDPAVDLPAFSPKRRWRWYY